MLIAAVDLGCSEEVLTIIGMLSAQNIFYRWACCCWGGGPWAQQVALVCIATGR
jgi:hypothetical protein